VSREKLSSLVLAALGLLCLLTAYYLIGLIYHTGELRQLTLEDGLVVQVLDTVEGWGEAQYVHRLDEGLPGQVLGRISPRVGPVQIVVRRIDSAVGGQGLEDLARYVEALEELRRERRDGGLYYVFWKSDTSNFWRLEVSFAGLPGYRLLQWAEPPGFPRLRYLIMDTLVAHRGHFYQVTTYAPQLIYHYYEVDIKYILNSIELPGS